MIWACILTRRFPILILERGFAYFFNRCFIPFHECIFSTLKFNLPFTEFEEWVLRPDRITPSPMHMVAWAFLKMFQYWCEYWNQEPSLTLFFNIFIVTRTSADSATGQWSISLSQLVKVFLLLLWKLEALQGSLLLGDPILRGHTPCFARILRENLPQLPLVQSLKSVSMGFKSVAFRTSSIGNWAHV